MDKHRKKMGVSPVDGVIASVGINERQASSAGAPLSGSHADAWEQAIISFTMLALHAQTFLDMSCQPFIDFRMPRNGLLRAIRWIPVNVVPASVPQEITSPALQVFDELAPFHTAISFI